MPASPPLRLRHYDYSTPGAYLITITTAGRVPSLGTLTRDGTLRTRLGDLVAAELARTTAVRTDVIVDAVAILPDHVHFILRLTGQRCGGSNISRIVNGLKAAVTSEHRRRRDDPTVQVWQRGFHDRVIRSERALHAIRRYVLENPARAWLTQARTRGSRQSD